MPVIQRPLRTIIESPFSAPTASGLSNYRRYLIRAMKDSIARGEAPFASHLMYTEVLKDTDPAQRALGIYLGQIWLFAAEQAIFYADYGITPGMEEGRLAAAVAGKPTQMRYIGKNSSKDALYVNPD